MENQCQICYPDPKFTSQSNNNKIIYCLTNTNQEFCYLSLPNVSINFLFEMVKTQYNGNVSKANLFD